MELFAMGGDLPQGIQQFYQQTYNPAFPTPHGYAKGGKLPKPFVQVEKWADGKYRVYLLSASHIKNNDIGTTFNDVFTDVKKANVFAKKLANNNKAELKPLDTSAFDFVKKQKMAKGGQIGFKEQSIIK